MSSEASKPPHLPDEEAFALWAKRNADQPLRILSSACLAGNQVGFDGTDNGEYPVAQALLQRPEVRLFGFCPEDFAFGTPRPMCDIHGGDGFDVLDGRARVLTDQGDDWTDDLIDAAEVMAAYAKQYRVDLCLMLDVSASCGSTVISDGPRAAGQRVPGAGVCAARLMREGLPVISQRDYATLARLHRLFEPAWVSPEPERDHYRHPWFVENFGEHQWRSEQESA